MLHVAGVVTTYDQHRLSGAETRHVANEASMSERISRGPDGTAGVRTSCIGGENIRMPAMPHAFRSTKKGAPGPHGRTMLERGTVAEGACTLYAICTLRVCEPNVMKVSSVAVPRRANGVGRNECSA